MTWDHVRDAIVEWLRTATGQTVIWSNRPHPQPVLPYVRVQMLVCAPAGRAVQGHAFDPEGQPGQELVFAAASNKQLTVSVQAEASTPEAALQSADAVLDALQLEPVASALYATGLGFLGADAVHSIAQLTDADPRGRAQVDVRFSLGTLQTARGTFIETVRITPTTTAQGSESVEGSPIDVTIARG